MPYERVPMQQLYSAGPTPAPPLSLGLLDEAVTSRWLPWMGFLGLAYLLYHDEGARKSLRSTAKSRAKGAFDYAKTKFGKK